MALTEIEFDLPASQFEMMGYPHLKQGHALTVQLETGFVTPDWAGDAWYAVQKEALPAQFVRTGRAEYAYSGQILAAEIEKHDGIESATLMVQCGEIPLRAACGPSEDGRLPYGTWETRYLAGYSRISGIVEDAFESSVGQQINVTIWSFRRLVLRPGDPQFGQWHETEELLPTPYGHDRITVTARVHRQVMI